jgi:hypothetical protein
MKTKCLSDKSRMGGKQLPLPTLEHDLEELKLEALRFELRVRRYEDDPGDRLQKRRVPKNSWNRKMQ